MTPGRFTRPTSLSRGSAGTMRTLRPRSSTSTGTPFSMTRSITRYRWALSLVTVMAMMVNVHRPSYRVPGYVRKRRIMRTYHSAASADDASTDHARLLRHRPRHDARRARSDNRGHSASCDRGRSPWLRAPVLGRDRLSPDVDDHRAAVWQALRPLRTQTSLRVRDRPVPARISALRPVAHHDAPHCISRHPGPGRRRRHSPRAGDHRRDFFAPRALPVPGLYGLAVRGEL